MRKIMFFLYFIVSTSAISLDALQALMVDKKYAVHGIFYKYDFANVEDAWDFVYVANNVYYQLKGTKATSNNIFGWKIIDALSVSSPSFYFVYLSDIDEDNNTKYDWVALSKENSTINKLIGSTSNGYFSWSENLSKLSFSFSDGDKQVTFTKSINGGTPLSDAKLPKFPDLSDLPDINNTSANNDNNKDDDKKDDDKDDNKDDDKDKNKDDDKDDDKKTDDGKKDDDKGNDDSGSGDTNKDDANSDCTSYVKKDPNDDSPPSPGVCFI